MLRVQQMMLGSGANHPATGGGIVPDTGLGWSLAAGSIAGNGVMYATIPNDGDFAVGTGNFCVEWWQWLDPNSRGNGRQWQIGTYPAPLGVSMEGGTTSRTIYFWIGGGNQINYSFTSDQMKTFHSQWHHFCIERVSGTTAIYYDGQAMTSAGGGYNITESSAPINLLSEAGGSNPMAGYIADFHFVKNNYKYNGNFTPPTAPITPVTGTVCLLNAFTSDGGIKDSSPVNKSINMVSAYWSPRGPYLAPVLWVDGTTNSYAGSGSSWTNLGRDDATVTLSGSMGTDVVVTTGFQNNGTGHGTDTVGFFAYGFQGGSGGLPDLTVVQPGWHVTDHPDWIVTNVNTTSLTITISGGVFTDGASYSFTSPSAMYFNVDGHFGGPNSAYAYVTAGSHPFLGALPDGMTVLAVYDMISSGNNYERIIDFGNGAASHNIILCKVGTSDNLAFAVYNASNNEYRATVNNGAAAGMKIAVATDDANNEILRVSGLSSSSSAGVAIPNGPRSHMYIGKSNWGDAPLQGKIYHLSIFDRVLTTSEITLAQQILKDKYQPDPVTLKLSLDAGNPVSYAPQYTLTVNTVENSGTELHIPKMFDASLDTKISIGYPVATSWGGYYTTVTGVSSGTGNLGPEWIVTVATNVAAGFSGGSNVTFGNSSTWTDTVSNIPFTLYNSPTYSADNGGYLSFAPNNSQYADSTTGLSALSTWTVEAWHYYTGEISGNACLLSEKFSGTYINFAIGTLDQGTIQTGYYNGWHTTAPYALNAGNWYHIVGVYDGTNVKLYVNGVLVRQALSDQTAPLHSGSGINIMRRWDNPDLWGGRLAVMRIYEGPLNQNEVAYNFNSSKSRFGF